MPSAVRRPRKPGQATADSILIEHLEQEVKQFRETAQTTREELQSANEELQSANEALTTSKEELQSLNEELQTVNAELQAQLDELSRANNDMKNLLNSTDIAPLFLDDALRVRRFTTQAAKLIKLIPSNVGRPITDIASALLYSELAEEVAEVVLRTLVFVERPITGRNGRWFTARIMPYRTLENRIDGVVVTFADITEAKTLEAELRQTRDELAAQLASKTAELSQTHAALPIERARSGPATGSAEDAPEGAP